MDMQNALPEAESDSLADALSAAFDHIDAGGKAPEAPELEIDQPQDALESSEQVEATPAEPEEASSTPEQPQDAAAQEQPETSAEDEPAQAQPSAPEDKAPSSWTPAVAQKWGDLPPEVRAEIQRRETDYHKGIEQYKQAAAIAQEYERVLAPNLDMIQQAGVAPSEALEYLFNAHRTLTYGSPEQKREAIARIARDCQIDLTDLAPAAPIDPHVQQLMHQNQQLLRYQQMTQQQQQQEVLSQIEAFRANPENVHFEAVKDDMAILLQSGRAANLQDAYDKAVWMRPDIRQTLVQQQRTDAQKKAAEQQRQARAKTAAGGVRGAANPKATTVSPDASLRDTLEMALDGNL